MLLSGLLKCNPTTLASHTGLLPLLDRASMLHSVRVLRMHNLLLPVAQPQAATLLFELIMVRPSCARRGSKSMYMQLFVGSGSGFGSGSIAGQPLCPSASWCVTRSLEVSHLLWDTCIGPECCWQGVFFSMFNLYACSECLL